MKFECYDYDNGGEPADARAVDVYDAAEAASEFAQRCFEAGCNNYRIAVRRAAVSETKGCRQPGIGSSFETIPAVPAGEWELFDVKAEMELVFRSAKSGEAI